MVIQDGDKNSPQTKGRRPHDYIRSLYTTMVPNISLKWRYVLKERVSSESELRTQASYLNLRGLDPPEAPPCDVLNVWCSEEVQLLLARSLGFGWMFTLLLFRMMPVFHFYFVFWSITARGAHFESAECTATASKQGLFLDKKEKSPGKVQSHWQSPECAIPFLGWQVCPLYRASTVGQCSFAWRSQTRWDDYSLSEDLFTFN